jgi:hypothetical protein
MSWLSTLFGGRDTTVAEQAMAGNIAATKPDTFPERAVKEMELLNRHVKSISREISPAVYSRLRSIDDLVRPLVAYIETRPVLIEKEIEIESLLTDYIPTPLNIFMQLTPKERADGSKADLLLLSQYDTLERSVIELGKGIYTDTMSELEVHAAFVERRFQAS